MESPTKSIRILPIINNLEKQLQTQTKILISVRWNIRKCHIFFVREPAFGAVKFGTVRQLIVEDAAWTWRSLQTLLSSRDLLVFFIFFCFLFLLHESSFLNHIKYIENRKVNLKFPHSSPVLSRIFRSAFPPASPARSIERLKLKKKLKFFFFKALMEERRLTHH